MATEFRVLGAVEAHQDGHQVDLGPPRQRGVLAVLLLHANHSVSVDQFLDHVWGEHLPQRGRDALYSYLSRLRSILATMPDVALQRRSIGYRLTVDEAAVDVYQFRELVAEARASADDTAALTLFDRALALWRGPVLAELDSPWAASVRTTLEAERRTAAFDRTDAALRSGQHAELLADLITDATHHPLDERLAGQVMLALYRSGRQADALRHYQHIREELAEQLGADPTPDLQEVHRRILIAAPVPVRPAAQPAGLPTPHQLPPAPAEFIGRADELAALTMAMNDAIETGRTPVVFALAGAGGVGKTWLALQWAHQQLDRFPDGQLFVDLQGFAPGGEPVAAATAARELLAALGVEPDRIPPDLRARSTLLRSLVANRRMLIVLDNAADAAAVTPLLPGASPCVVIVTSRRQLTGLVVRHSARHFPIGTLTDQDARELVAVRLGRERVAAEPAAFEGVLRLCAGMPLALAIVSARAQIASGTTLANLADRLHDERSRLRVLDDDDDPTASLPSVLSWSVSSLTDEQATSFALLGFAPGPDIGPAAAASLVGSAQDVVGTQFDALVNASLIERGVTHRYRMHDLVRLYARDLASDDAVRSAVRRVTDFYLHTAYGANRIITPHGLPLDLEPPVEGCVPLVLNDNAAAMAWFDTEHVCLMATQHIAADHGWHQVVWLLTRILNTYHIRRARHGEELVSCQAGLVAARHLADPAVVIMATRRLGDAWLRVGERKVALEHLDQALALAEEIGDQFEQAQTHRFLAMARSSSADGRQAVEHAERALDLYRAVGFAAGEAEALSLVGWLAAQIGEYAYARENCVAAVELCRRQDNQDGLAATFDSLGYIDRNTGRLADAVANYEQALALFRALGNNYQLAATLDDIGSVHAEMGRPDRALAVWTESEALYLANGRDADSDRVRKQIADLDTKAVRH